MLTDEERTREQRAIARYRREGRRQAVKRRITTVAGLELCKELYRLSGWNDTYFGWTSTNKQSAWVDVLPEDFAELNYPLITPAYDLGYLLRKLPPHITLQDLPDEGGWYCLNSETTGEDYTPEDATATLAIMLLQQGILGTEDANAGETRPGDGWPYEEDYRRGFTTD